MLRLRTLIPIILILVSILVAYFYIKPMYYEIMQTKHKKAQIVDAIEKTKEIGSIVNTLRSNMKNIPNGDMDKLDTILPSSVDDVRYLNMVNSLAGEYKLSLKDLKIADAKNKENVNIQNPTVNTGNKIENISIDFSVSAKYEVFKKFLSAIENSLVLLNVNSISLNTSKADTSKKSSPSKDEYTYNVKLTTYLKK